MGNVVFLGVEGSGKTTLAMALTKAFARHADEGWYLRPEGRGAYNFATIAPGDFAIDGFPVQTSAAREMTWKIARDGADVGGIRILDYPGEIYRLAFLAAEEESDPEAFRARVAANAEELAVLNRAIEEADSLYVLFNLQDALDLRGDDANRSAVWVTNECLKRLKALPSKPRVTLVFTQVDRYQTEDDFLHSFTPAELDLIGHDHPDVKWMMVSVLVPPDSEFGIDAFVRRVTGLTAFGVPDGRPRARVASGGALARLAAQRKAEGEGRAPARPESDAQSESDAQERVPPTSNPDAQERVPPARGRNFLTLVLLFAALFGLAYLIVAFLQKPVSRHRSRDIADADDRDTPHVVTQVVMVAVSGTPPAAIDTAPVETATKAALSSITNVVPDVATNDKPAAAVTSAVPAAAATNDMPAAAVTNLAPAAVATNDTPVVVVTNLAPAAITNSVAVAAATNEISVVSVQSALSNETAVALAAARKCATPYEAREILTYAVDMFNSTEAIYERARVDDFLGWGAYVRTREEKMLNPPWTNWLRRIDLLGEKKAVVMMYPLTSNNAHIAYRTQALEGYRAAAARGLPAAVDALVRHASHENNKDVRRSSAENTEAN